MWLRGPTTGVARLGSTVSGNPLTPGSSLWRGFNLIIQSQECGENWEAEGKATSRRKVARSCSYSWTRTLEGRVTPRAQSPELGPVRPEL